MNLGKGLTFSAVGALAGAVAWIILVKLTGWSLWVLAPIVGGAAGYGMMRATQMRGGIPAGAIAAVVTLCGVFGARYFIVTQDVRAHLRITDDEAISLLAAQVASDLEDRGYESFDDDGNYTPRVERKTREIWDDWSPAERDQFIASQQHEREQVAGLLTPLTLLLDFGIFGTVCTILAAGTAFKTASITLERALQEKGLAAGAEDAAGLAAKMRADDSAKRGIPAPASRPQRDDEPVASSTGGFRIPMRAEAEERPLPRIKIISTEDPPELGPDQRAA